MEDKKIKAGKPYEELTAEEKALIVDFKEEEHAELKTKYGKRLKYVTVQVDEDERYDYLIVRPSKKHLVGNGEEKGDLEEANDILIRNCVAAGNMKALDDSAVYTSVFDRHWAVNRWSGGFYQQSIEEYSKSFSLVEGIDAILKKVYGVDVPDKLDEDEWLRLYAEYRMLRKTELEEFEIVVHNAVAKVVNRLFSKDNASDSMDIGTG